MKHPLHARILEWFRRVLHWLGILFGAWLILGILWVGCMLYESVAVSKISAANTNARCVVFAFTQAAQELEEDGMRPEHSEAVYVGRLDALDKEDALQCRMIPHIFDNGYYAVVTDQNWHVRYALWSRSEITQDRICPCTVDDQRSFMFSPFQKHGKLIGYYEGM